ncbi:MAG: hypothetical protein AAB874_05485 [Patescibacteria group bacterium]
MQTVFVPTKLPLEFYKFFWDVDAQKLNPQEKSYYVINRLLDKGDLEAARWVLKTFSKESIVETLKTMRDFSPWNGNFWASFLNIPKEEVKCLNPSYLKLRKTHWPY